jgi:DNA replication protein DnaC
MYDPATKSGVLRRWLSASRIPRRFWGIDLDWHDDVPAQVTDWLSAVESGDVIRAVGPERYGGLGLLLDGDPGVGKTTLACTVGQTLLLWLADAPPEARAQMLGSRLPLASTTVPVVYTSYADLLVLVKGGFSDPAKAELAGTLFGRSEAAVPVLILDDLGKEYATDYTTASFHEVIRTRYDRGLPTIITTNVPLGRWASAYGPAAASFAREAFECVPIMCADRRRK